VRRMLSVLLHPLNRCSGFPLFLRPILLSHLGNIHCYLCVHCKVISF
jgi:hypothetical protein